VVKPPRLRPSASSALAWHLPLLGCLGLGFGGGAAGSGRVLVGTHHGAVHRKYLPLDLALGIRLCLERLQDPFPDPGTTPAHQAVVTGLPGAIPVGEIPPRGAGAQAPEDPIDHLTMVFVRMAWLAVGRGQ
jgi:hypothetical protein